MASLEVRRREPVGATGYRSAKPLPRLELARGSFYTGRVWLSPLLVALIGVGVTTSGIFLAHIAILGAGSFFFMLAGLLLFTALGGRAWLRVDDVRVRGRCSGTSLDVAREEIVSLGTGSEAGSRTVWVNVKGEGRHLVLDGLSEDDAATAIRELREALGNHVAAEA
jgi:hypothetical protein